MKNIVSYSRHCIGMLRLVGGELAAAVGLRPPQSPAGVAIATWRTLLKQLGLRMPTPHLHKRSNNQMTMSHFLKFAGAALMTASGALAQGVAPIAPDAKGSPTDLPEPFNPARCKHGDKKYVYWAAGDQVFRFKFDPTVPLRSTAESELTGVRLDAKREVPPAPDPTEAEGCYRNPLRAGVVPYMEKFDAQLFQSIVGRKLQASFWAIRELQAVPKNWDASLNVGQRLWQRVQHSCWMRAPGFHECLLSSGTSRTDYSVSHLFKIEAKILPTYPQASDVFFVLQNDAASGHFPNGKEAYSVMQIYGGVRLGIGFRLFPEEIDFMVPYFSGLINYVVQAHLPNYKWMPVKTNQPKQRKP